MLKNGLDYFSLFQKLLYLKHVQQVFCFFISYTDFPSWWISSLDNSGKHDESCVVKHSINLQERYGLL